MLDWIYKKRLKDDLEIWVSKGWVSSDGAVAILTAQDEDDGKSRLPMALAGIGMVCVALALFAFIAANWGVIPKAIKLAGIAALIVSAHWAAAAASARGRKGVADLAAGFATLTFVGGMALIGQIFHLPSDWAGGAFLVCLGALAAAWLTGSKTSLVIAAVAAITWQVTRSGIGEATPMETWIGLGLLIALFAHPFFFPASLSRLAAILMLLVTYGRWFAEVMDGLGAGDAVNIAMVQGGVAGLAAVMIQLGAVADLYAKWSSYKPVRSHAHWLMFRALQDVGFMILCGLLVFGLVLAPELSNGISVRGLLPLPASLPLALAVFLCVTGLLLSFKTPRTLALFAATGAALIGALAPVGEPHIVVLAAIGLAALIGLCALGTWYNNRFWMLCGYLGLTAVALWLLEETIGSLLDQSLFFLVAGLVLLAMALGLTRFLRRGAAKGADTENAEGAA